MDDPTEDDGLSAAPPTFHCVAIARPLPSFWPTPSLPRAHATLLATRASACELEGLTAAEEESWSLLVKKPTTTTVATPPSKKARKQKAERSAKNEVGTLCKCGKLDAEKFMLQCDGCDVWYHGDCVGVTQAQGMRLKSWRCRSCARKYESVRARTELYCVCRGPWDGKAFMIACDSARHACTHARMHPFVPFFILV